MSDTEIKSNTVEEKVRGAISKIPGLFKPGVKDKVWTKALFKSLSELGKSLGYGVCSSCHDGEYECGWLYDLVWYDTYPDGKLKSVPLLLESEWDKKYDGIKYDFEKLLLGKATYKVMIFQAWGERMQDYFNQMKVGIEAFECIRNPHERYILACFDESR